VRRRGDDDEGLRAADDPLQGDRLGEEGPIELEQQLEPLVVVEEGRHREERVKRRQRVELEGLRRGFGQLVGEQLVGEQLVGQRLGAGRIDERLMAPTAADWITLAEASEILEAANVRFRPETIGSWARAGKLQSIKLGGRRFVRRGEVRALVAGPRRVRADDLQASLFEELRR